MAWARRLTPCGPSRYETLGNSTVSFTTRALTPGGARASTNCFRKLWFFVHRKRLTNSTPIPTLPTLIVRSSLIKDDGGLSHGEPGAKSRSAYHGALLRVGRRDTFAPSRRRPSAGQRDRAVDDPALHDAHQSYPRRAPEDWQGRHRRRLRERSEQAHGVELQGCGLGPAGWDDRGPGPLVGRVLQRHGLPARRARPHHRWHGAVRSVLRRGPGDGFRSGDRKVRPGREHGARSMVCHGHGDECRQDYRILRARREWAGPQGERTL